MRDMSANEKVLQQNLLALTEMQHVLIHSRLFLDEMDQQSIGTQDTITNSGSNQSPLSSAQPARHKKTVVEIELNIPVEKLAHDIRFISGCVPNVRKEAFTRLLYRACRGNVMIRMADISEMMKDPATVSKPLFFYGLAIIQGESILKSVFMVFVQGEKLEKLLKKICEG